VLVTAATASGAVVPVNNDNDSGPGSLRQAIVNADPGDTLAIPRGHYNLTSGALIVDKALVFRGAGARKTVIDANGNSRVLEIDNNLGTVRLKKLTIREGSTDGMDDGGGVFVEPETKLILTRVAVLNNRAITLTDFSDGGGIQSDDEVVVRRSLFAGNRAYNGGAVNAQDGLTAIASTFSGNSGGNINFNGDSGVTNDEATFIDSTLTRNSCFNEAGCGGAVFSEFTFRGSIIANNTAYDDNGIPPGQPGNLGVPDNCAEAATSLGHNLDDLSSGDGECQLSRPSDISGRNPKLRRLRFNGGDTKTHAIRRRSPAFNAGGRSCERRDQRGVRRPQGRRCDIGAYELKR
jgi:hypothetical protein